MSLKALSMAVLLGNSQGNRKETMSFLDRKPGGKPSTFQGRVPTVQCQSIGEVFAELDRLGSWDGIRAKAATACPDLLAAAKVADKELDKAPEDRQTLERNYNRWRAVWLACQTNVGA